MVGYFVIRSTADGTTFDGPISAETLSRRLASEDYGHVRSFAKTNPGTDGFCIRTDEDQLLIIKGEIVQPEPVAKVTDWRLP